MNNLKWQYGLLVLPSSFLLHVHTTIHLCKQMGLGMNFASAKKSVEVTIVGVEIAKEDDMQAHNSKERKKGGKG